MPLPVAALIVYAVVMSGLAAWQTFRLRQAERLVAHLRMEWADFDARFTASPDDPQAD